MKVRLLLTTAATLAAVLMSAPAQARTVPDVKVFTSNLGSGAECSAGCMVTAEAQIALWSPDAVALQEVCEADRDAFAANHPDWSVAWRTMITDYAGCDGGDKGDMVAAPVAFDRTQTIDLPGDFTAPDGTHRDYGAVCADIGDIWVCSTHLTAPGVNGSQATRDSQVGKLRTVTRPWSQVALCGDFNMVPSNSALDQLRNVGYLETDHVDNEVTQGVPTRTTKFDYIWWHRGSDNPPAAVSGLVVSQPTSHHDLLRGSVTW